MCVNEKHFCFFFTASRALLQRHAELNKLLHVIYAYVYYIANQVKN